MSTGNPIRKRKTFNNANDPRRKTPQDYHDLAKSVGLEWLGTETFNGHTPTQWRCGSCGHEWMTTYSHIKSGTKCPKCTIKRLAKQRAFTEEDYLTLASQKNIIWLGPYPEHTEIRTTWQCDEGHVWETTYRSLSTQSKKGCPYCAGNVKKKPEDYHKLASEKGFRWVGEIPVGRNSTTLWECSNGHKWSSSYGNIAAGHGCRYCWWLRLKRRAKSGTKRTYQQSVEHRQRRQNRINSLPNNFGQQAYDRMMEYWGNACAISGETENLHVDHWIPLNSSDCPGTISENMIPLAAHLNSSKGYKNPATWLIRKFGQEHGGKLLAEINEYFDWLKTL